MDFYWVNILLNNFHKESGFGGTQIYWKSEWLQHRKFAEFGVAKWNVQLRDVTMEPNKKMWCWLENFPQKDPANNKSFLSIARIIFHLNSKWIMWHLGIKLMMNSTPPSKLWNLCAKLFPSGNDFFLLFWFVLILLHIEFFCLQAPKCNNFHWNFEYTQRQPKMCRFIESYNGKLRRVRAKCECVV